MTGLIVIFTGERMLFEVHDIIVMEISSVSYELSKEVEEFNRSKYLGYDQYLIEKNKKLKKWNEESLMRNN